MLLSMDLPLVWAPRGRKGDDVSMNGYRSFGFDELTALPGEETERARLWLLLKVGGLPTAEDLPPVPISLGRMQ